MTEQNEEHFDEDDIVKTEFKVKIIIVEVMSELQKMYSKFNKKDVQKLFSFK